MAGFVVTLEDQHPEPALFPAGPVTGFVAVENGLPWQLPLQFGAGFGHRFTGLFPAVLNMYKVMKALVDVKYDGIVHLDHFVPMVGGNRTYEAFAVGYM